MFVGASILLSSSTKKMDDVPLPVRQESSLGTTGMANKLREALSDAESGELNDAADIAYAEEQKAWLGDAYNKLYALRPTPMQTQEDYVEEGDKDDDKDDDRELTKLEQDHQTKSSISYEQKNICAEMYEMDKKNIVNPIDKIVTLRENIDGMPDGEQKKSDIVMFNTIVTMFEETRLNAGLRAMIADLFSAQDEYYRVKGRRKVLEEKNKLLTKIYNQREKADVLADLERKQAAREEAMKNKGAQYADKKRIKGEEKAAASAEAASSKKAKK